MEINKIIEFKENQIDTLKIEKWNYLSKKNKAKSRTHTIKNNLRIKNDSSLITQILYYGAQEKIKIKQIDSNDKIINLERESEKYFYYNTICYPSKEKTYELLSFPRNSGIKEITIYFYSLKRFAKLKIDTQFSEIYINPQFDIELIEFEERKSINKTDNVQSTKFEKVKLVNTEDNIILDQRYAGDKHSL